MRHAPLATVWIVLACSSGLVGAKPGKPPGKPATKAARAPVLPVARLPVFSPEVTRPYFDSGPAQPAAAYFAIEDWQNARDAFTAWLQTASGKTTSADTHARAKLLVAVCEENLGHYAEAARGYERALTALPMLADFVHLHAARSLFFQGDLARASEHTRAVSADSIFSDERSLLDGDLLRAGGKWAEAEKLYSEFLERRPGHAQALFYLAEAREALGKAVPHALKLYRKLVIEHPLSGLAAKATARYQALLKKVPKKAREAYAQLSAAELITRGNVYFEAMRNPEAEADFAAALAAPDGGGAALYADKECYARFQRAQSVFKQRQRTRSAPLFDEATEACAKTRNADLQTRSVYQAGRAYTYSYDSDKDAAQKAIERFARAETWNPTHSFADDARMREAEVWQRLADEGQAGAADKVTELLSTLPDLFPNGDMRAEALWRLAWRAYRAGDFAQAITWLDKQIATVGHDYNYWAEGQAYYWKGRSYARLGDKVRALLAYEDVVVDYPLSYYALLALNRVREEYPGDFERIKAVLARPPEDWQKNAPTFVFQPRALYGDPGFLRAIEFMRLGLGREAQRELNHLGVRVPSARAEVSDPDAKEQLWAAALLFDRAGRWDQSHWILRYAIVDYRNHWPVAQNRERWRLAYPKGYGHLLEPAARTQGVSPELLFAIVREESAFNPLIESFANAIGLTQMIFPTARRFGKNLGFAITRENLRDPEKNVAVGSRFLAFLWKTFAARAGLMVPAYNAGEGAVWRWLCERGDWPQDEFAEAIPYDETRNYSKRVLNSYFVYSYLYGGVVPEMPNVIPDEVKNLSRCAKKPSK